MPNICKCGLESRPGQRTCKVCHSAYMREWRKHNALTPEQRYKDNARSYAGVYLRRGKIDKENCRVCGKSAEMHHEDYDKPLEVNWLCREHHMDLHIS